jgi:ubiquitin C-terminal hydrolase
MTELAATQMWLKACFAWAAQTLDLGDVYLGVPKGECMYCMRAVVCYYGAHYQAFVHTSRKWIMFDDASTNVVGSWESVKYKCQLGKIQPSVLFFEARF